jgi:hypothetical protein
VVLLWSQKDEKREEDRIIEEEKKILEIRKGLCVGL